MSGSWGEQNGTGPSEQCQSLISMLAAFAEGALSPEETRFVSAHVADCSWCAARVAAYAEVDALMRQAPIPSPPASLRAGLYARIAATQASPASERHRASELGTIVRDTETQPTISELQTTPLPRRSGSRRIAPWASVVAAVLVVALLAGLFAVRQPSRSGTRLITLPTETFAQQRDCAPNEIQASLPAHSTIKDLALTGPGSGWAVGSVADSDSMPKIHQGLILHYSACKWQPIGIDLLDTELVSIAMISPREGWATGQQDGAPLLLHYKDGTWSTVVPPDTDSFDSFSAVRALSAEEIWVVGHTPADKGGHTHISLLHLSAGQWTRIETPFEIVNEIAPVGHDDLWLIGYNYPNFSKQVFTLDHYQEGVLTDEISLAASMQLNHLRMIAPNNGWATGFIYVNGPQPGTLLNEPVAMHYDGSQWSPVAFEGNSQASTNRMEQIYYLLSQTEVWSYSVASDLPSVKADLPESHIALVQRRVAGHWQITSWALMGVVTMSDLTCVKPDNCWAIGAYLLPAVTTYDSTGNETGSYRAEALLLLHYMDGTWREYGRNN